MFRIAPLWLLIAVALRFLSPSLTPAAELVKAFARTPLPPAVTRTVDFAKDVQPLLAKHCVKCHGPDKQKSGWRADVKEAALNGGDEHAPNILPGKSAESPLIRFVAGLDAEVRMPEKGEPLTTEEIGILRAWIDQGARWPEPAAGSADESRKHHWAFQPLARPEPPAPAETGHGSGGADVQPIDAFLRARLAERHLQPGPEADRRTLLRRLTFDLTGLPPTPEELAAFLADTAPRAYDRVVDRLLGSPHYGERWARHWLDVVRFAESHGFEENRPRPQAWPYRDYVIRAFNEDKPYDQFIREQLAGDAFGVDEATGFLVGGPYDEVKSPDPVLTAQQRADELHDMVSATGGAFLGLTVGCARCHNHKFDPILQTDYYAMTAVFQGVQHGERPMHQADSATRAAEIKKVGDALERAGAGLRPFRPRAKLHRTLFLEGTPAAGPPLSAADLITYSPGSGRGQADDPGDVARLPNLSGGYSARDAAAGKKTAVFCWDPHATGRFRIWLSWGMEARHTENADYFLLGEGDSLPDEDEAQIAAVSQRLFADGAPGMPGQKQWSGFFNAGVHELNAASQIIVRAGEGPVANGLVILEEVPEGDPPEVVAPHLRAPVSATENEELLDPIEAKFVRFTISATVSGDEPCLDELEVYTAQPQARNVALAQAGGKAAVSSVYQDGADPKHQRSHLNDGRYGNAASWISNEKGKGWAQVELARPEVVDRIVWSRARNPADYQDRLPAAYQIAVSLDGGNWQTVATSADRLGAGFRKRFTILPTFCDLPRSALAQAAAALDEQVKLVARLKELTTPPVVYAGRFESPAPTHRLNRGDPLQPKEEVAPGGIAEFGGAFGLPGPIPEQQRRRALAEWIASPKNPLTARVIANRLWHYHFGAGIVETPSDFGLNGGKPSHPALLDWLASELISHQWSLKHLQRLIVTSAAYRQSGAPREDALKVDASARLLWRFPPRRLEAEELRDSLLAVSGKLDPRMGGPGFDLFEPNENYVKLYVTKKACGPEEFRRMVYQSKPRVQLDDVFGAFDCPDGGQTAPRRTSSTTPLQALNLLNSPFALQQAQFTGERLVREGGASPEDQAARGFALAFGRAPSADEATSSAKFIREHGVALFCRALFNANEFIEIY